MATIIRNNTYNNFILATLGADKVVSGSGNDTIYTYLGDDVVNSGDGNDTIFTGEGDDTVVSMGGDNHVNTGIGNDTVTLGNGKNTVFTGIGDDKVTSGSGNDYIDAGIGNNTVDAGEGNNNVVSYWGHDKVTTGSGDDTIRTGAGNDVINSGDGHDWIDAGIRNDVVHSGNGDDLIYGGFGNDYIDAGSGNDEVWAGAGDDTAVFSAKDNVGNKNYYNGGLLGCDKLILKLTRDEYDNPDFQQEWVNYQKFAENPYFLQKLHYTFFSLDLKIYSWEHVELQVAVKAQDDQVTTAEDKSVTVDVLANDLGEGMTIDPASLSASNGSVTLVDGKLVYVPDANYFGNDAIQYKVTDKYGNISTAEVAVTVTPVNDIPTADNITQTLDEEMVLVGLLPAESNAADIDGDNLTFSLVKQAEHGTVTVSADGAYTYTPAANYNGQDSFTFKVSDGNGGEVTQTVSIDVTPVNDAPTAQDSTKTTAEDTAVTGNLAAESQAKDIDGDALTYSVVTQSQHGVVVLQANGEYTYTPAENYHGNDTFTYKITDGNGGEATHTVNITVTPVNDAPTANDVAQTTQEDVVLAGNVLVESNAADIDGDALTVSLNDKPQHGQITLAENGDYTYTPTQNFNGKDSFTFTVNDGQGGEVTKTVTIDVTPVNDDPTADAVAKTVDEDAVLVGQLAVESNAADVDGDALTYSLDTQAAHGVVVVQADGKYTYTPAANYNGNDSFTFTVNDGQGGTVTKTVAITVTPINDAPTANDVAKTTDEDTVLTGNLLTESNATDVDGDALVFTLKTSTTQGVVVLQNDGKYRYTPAENFNGTDSFTFIITDGKGGSITHTANITVNPVNDLPQLTVDTADVEEAKQVTVDVLANDRDVEGALTLTNVNITGGKGTVKIVNNQLVYEATDYDALNEGEKAQVTVAYTVTDTDGATATSEAKITVIGKGQLETKPDEITVSENGSVTFDVLANDISDSGNALTLVSATTAAGDIVAVRDNKLYVESVNRDALAEGETATYTVNYVASDSLSQQQGTATVTVTGENDAPVATNDTAEQIIVMNPAGTTKASSNTLVNGLGGDAGFGENKISGADDQFSNKIDLSSVFKDGINFNGQLYSGIYLNANGNITFERPDIRFTPESIETQKTPMIAVFWADVALTNQTTKITDGGNSEGTNSIYYDLDPTTGTVTITWDDVSYFGANTTNDKRNAFQLQLINKGNGDFDIVYRYEDVNWTTGNSSQGTDGLGGTVARAGYTDAQGKFVELAASGKQADMLAMETTKGNTDVAGVWQYSVTNGAVAETPVTRVKVLTNDTDVDNNDELRVVSATVKDGLGNVTVDGNELVYTPAKDYNSLEAGQVKNVVLEYTIADKAGAQSTATVTIPVLKGGLLADTATVTENKSVTIDVLQNDISNGVWTLNTVKVVDGNGEAAVVDGKVVYTASNQDLAENVQGTVKLLYQAKDSNGVVASEFVNITVNGTRDLTAVVDKSEVQEHKTVTVDVLANDFGEKDGDKLTISKAQLVDGYGAVNVVDGKVVFNPDDAKYKYLSNEQTATAKIQYWIVDERGNESTNIVNVTVQAAPAPIANDDVIRVSEDGVSNIKQLLLANDESPSGGDIVISGRSYSDAYSFNTGNFELRQFQSSRVIGDGFAYSVDGDKLAAGETVELTLRYQIQDVYGGRSDYANAKIIVEGADDPVANEDVFEVNENETIVIDLLQNDVPLSADRPLKLTGISQIDDTFIDFSKIQRSPFGVQRVVDNKLEFTAEAEYLNEGQSVTKEFYYQVSDGQGGYAEQKVTVKINGKNEPIANTDTITVMEGDTVDIDVLANDINVNNGNLTITNVYFSGARNSDSDYPELDSERLSVVDGKIRYLAGDYSEYYSYRDTYITGYGYRGEDNLAAGEQATRTIRYTIDDGLGGRATGSVNVVVEGKDDPVSVNDTATVSESGTVVIDVLANDTPLSPTDTLTIQKAGFQYFDRYRDRPDFYGSASVEIVDNKLVFTAKKYDFLDSGQTRDVVVNYLATDGKGGTTEASVTVTVQGQANVQPDVAIVKENGTVTVDVLANDYAAFSASETLTLVSSNSLTRYLNGRSIASDVDIVDNKLVISPKGFDSLEPNESRNVKIYYTVEGSSGERASSYVTLTIQGSQDPSVVADKFTVKERSTTILDVLQNDAPLSNDPKHELTVVDVWDNDYRISSSDYDIVDNQIAFTPSSRYFDSLAEGASQTKTIYYAVKDNDGGYQEGSVELTIQGRADDDTDFLLVGNANDNVIDFSALTTATQVATGGTGTDTFDLSVTQDVGNKTITDFSVAQGDKLKLSDVLDSDGNGEINLTDLKAMVGQNGITEIKVHDETEGVHLDVTRSGSTDTTVVLNNIHATSLEDLVSQGILTF